MLSIASKTVTGYIFFLTASTLLVRGFRVASPFKYLSRKRDEDIARTDDAEQITQHVNNEFQLENNRHLSSIRRTGSTEEIELRDVPSKNTPSLQDNISETQDFDTSPSINGSYDQSIVAEDKSAEEIDNLSERLSSTADVLQPLPQQTIPASKWKCIRIYISQRLTFAHIVYGTLFILSFLVYLPISTLSPIYLPILLPLYLSMSVLAYYIALQVPDKIRFFLHPIVSGSAIVMLGMEVTESIKGGNLLTGLAKFSTGNKYLNILEGTSQGHIPGAGDVLFSLLDCSIISLSTVMFRFRKELKKHVSRILRETYKETVQQRKSRILESQTSKQTLIFE